MSKDKLGDRIKSQYENRTKQALTRRCPTIIRLDGKSFHTYTKNLDRPFDEGLIEDMQETTKFLCENIQGCKLGYTQSDEITLVLTDYDRLTTDAWFDYNVQKMTSISAAMATAKFNELRTRRIYEESKGTVTPYSKSKLAFFDSRVFQIADKEEVVNSLIWRQQDAERNSIQMLAQSLYSHKQLHGKNTSVLQDMCFEKGHNWNDLNFSKKRGSLILKNVYVNDELVKNVYPYTNEEKPGDLEFYPKGCRKDNEENSCRRYNPVYYEGSGYADSWDDIEIEKIRTKWELVDTPIFSKQRNIILDLI